MTIGEVMRAADELRPNKLSRALKTAWLNRAEGAVQTKIYKIDPARQICYAETDPYDTALLAPPPFDELYTLYLCAMIDYGNGQYGQYSNGKELYNEAMEEFAAWHRRGHRYLRADGEKGGQGHA